MNVSLVGYKPEVIVHDLEKKGIYISTRSACSSKQNEVSRVLKMMHLSEEVASSAIRISLSSLTTKEEIEIFVRELQDSLTNLKKKRTT